MESLLESSDGLDWDRPEALEFGILVVVVALESVDWEQLPVLVESAVVETAVEPSQPSVEPSSSVVVIGGLGSAVVQPSSSPVVLIGVMDSVSVGIVGIV